MQDIDCNFDQIIRTFILRYLLVNRQRGIGYCQQVEAIYIRMTSQFELKEVIINQLANLQLRTEHHLIALALWQQLAKWCKQHHSQLKKYPAPMYCIIEQSIDLLNRQEDLYTILSKQNELLCILLQIPIITHRIDNYRSVYRKLKEVKEFYPAAIKQNQKNVYLKCMQDTIPIICQERAIKTLEFIFYNIFKQLEGLQNTHEYIPSRLRVLKCIMKYLWYPHEEILFYTAFIVIKYSKNIINLILLNFNVALFEQLIHKLLMKQSIAALLVYEHVVITNVNKLLEKGSNIFLLNIFLQLLSNIFQSKFLKYFMKFYDINFMQVNPCNHSLQILYIYSENRANQKKPQYQLCKKYLNCINKKINTFLAFQNISEISIEKMKFYNLKKKQYEQIIQTINKKPNKICKLIENITNKQIRQTTIHQYVRIIKKSAHLDTNTMTTIFGSDNQISLEMFNIYMEQLMKDIIITNLQSFIRIFTSNFFLLGEGQQVGRIIQRITEKYYQLQKDGVYIIKSKDAAYVLAHAIILLNTDLHNPKNQKKMTLDDFIKMCSKINDGQDIPLHMLTQTYNNIKNNQINTFRDRTNMLGISSYNWMSICTDYQTLYLNYYDEELTLLDQQFYDVFIHNQLMTVVDQRQNLQLETLLKFFQYNQQTYECEIVQILKSMVKNRPHMPIHAIQKIMQFANFRNNKPSSSMISYFWLGAQIIDNFEEFIPTNIICEYLVFTWAVRAQLQDIMYLRQKAELRRIHKCYKEMEKKQQKKSIMDMFSNFLTAKDEESDSQDSEVNQYKNNFKGLSQIILNCLKKKYHCTKAIEFLIKYLHNQGQKLFQEFLSCLYMIFHLVHGQQEYLLQYQQFISELIVEQSSISKRINNLKIKDPKKYHVITTYCQFWAFKLILHFSQANGIKNQLFPKLVEFIKNCDNSCFLDLLAEIELNQKHQLDLKLISLISQRIDKFYPDQEKFKWFKLLYGPKQQAELMQKIQKIEEFSNSQKQMQKKQSIQIENKHKEESFQCIQNQKQSQEQNIETKQLNLQFSNQENQQSKKLLKNTNKIKTEEENIQILSHINDLPLCM